MNLLKKCGISDDEINLYGIDFLLQYLQFHHKDKFEVFFFGFVNEELKELRVKAVLNGLKTVGTISDLTLVCLNVDFLETKIIDEENNKGLGILYKDDFFEIFKRGEYLINNNENIYPKSVREEFRITKPLSNFDYSIKVESFSLSSDFEFDVNLYKGSCNCKDFINNKHSQYTNGDLRRYCKHLIRAYKSYFLPSITDEFKKFILENCYALKKDFKRINLTKVEKPIYLSYDLTGQECDIYFPYKNNVYEKFSYDFKGEYFDYEDKPHGYVKDLRIELNKIFRPEKEYYKKKKAREETKEIDANVNGCIYSFVFIVIVLFLIFSFSS